MSRVYQRRLQKAATQRPCMCCRAPFASTGNHHRLCDDCRVSSQDTSPMELTFEGGNSLLGFSQISRVRVVA